MLGDVLDNSVRTTETTMLHTGPIPQGAGTDNATDTAGATHCSDEAKGEILIENVEAYIETATKQTTGGHVWEAARTLLAYLHATPGALQAIGDGDGDGDNGGDGDGESSSVDAQPGLRVLELGAGTGYLSMHVARDFGDKVSTLVATEMVEGGALRWLEQNVERNRSAGHALPALRTAPLDWNWVVEQCDEDGADGGGRALVVPTVEGDDAQRSDGARALCSSFDLLLGSDLVYNDSGVYMLPRVLRALLRRGPPGAHALYAHTLNRFEFADHDFFKELKRAGLACTALWPEGEPQRDDEADGEDDDEGFSGELFPEQRVVIYRICLARGIR